MLYLFDCNPQLTIKDNRGRLTFFFLSLSKGLDQGLKDSGACGPRGHFVRAAMLFGNFQIIKIYVIWVIHRYLKVLG